MRALEFYSGIGGGGNASKLQGPQLQAELTLTLAAGMHYGLKLARADVEVAAAFDIDDMANMVYESNFGLRPHQVILVMVFSPAT